METGIDPTDWRARDRRTYEQEREGAEQAPRRKHEEAQKSRLAELLPLEPSLAEFIRSINWLTDVKQLASAEIELAANGHGFAYASAKGKRGSDVLTENTTYLNSHDSTPDSRPRRRTSHNSMRAQVTARPTGGEGDA